MGVPRFFRHILKNYPECSRQFTFQTKFPERIDGLYIDANGIIHNKVAEVFFPSKTDATKQQPRLRLVEDMFGDDSSAESGSSNNDDIQPPPTKKVKIATTTSSTSTTTTTTSPKVTDVYKRICDYIEALVKFVRPTRLLHVSIDGTAPLAKQAQQRQRRYKAASEASESDFATFDKCSITPGTEFITGLSRYMHDYFRKQTSYKTKSWWSRIRVVFSDASVAGEGEHACIEEIRANEDPEFVHCIHGLDADLFMLSLAAHRERMFLLREDQFIHLENDTMFYLCDIGRLRNLFCERWALTRFDQNRASLTCDSDRSPGWTTRNGMRNLVNDFVFICFIVGNDFLHMAPSVGDMNDMLLLAMETRNAAMRALTGYTSGGGSGDDGTDTHNAKSITTDTHINIVELTKFFQLLASCELNLLNAQCSMETPYPRYTLNRSYIDPHQPYKGVSLSKFRQEYYAKAGIVRPEQVPSFCKDYLEGLEWVHWYYHRPPLNWRWCYQHHYTPLLTDIADYLTHFGEINRVSQVSTPLNTPFQQLLGVVPPRCRNLLPIELRGIYDDPRLKKYYPTTFEIDREGKTAEWEGVILLPFVDIEVILNYYNTTATPQTVANPRNQFGEVVEYRGVNMVPV